MKKDGLARLQQMGLAEKILNGQTLEQHGGRLLKTDRIRQAHQALGRQAVEIAVGTQWAAGVSHTVTDLKAKHARPNGLHLTCGLGAKAGRQGGRGIEAAAKVGVDVIQTNGAVAHKHLALAKLGWRVRQVLKYLRATQGAELDSVRHGDDGPGQACWQSDKCNQSSEHQKNHIFYASYCKRKTFEAILRVLLAL
jgi:hypothetical protein